MQGRLIQPARASIEQADLIASAITNASNCPHPRGRRGGEASRWLPAFSKVQPKLFKNWLHPCGGASS
jgi:hypothetical protein